MISFIPFFGGSLCSNVNDIYFFSFINLLFYKLRRGTHILVLWKGISHKLYSLEKNHVRNTYGFDEKILSFIFKYPLKIHCLIFPFLCENLNGVHRIYLLTKINSIVVIRKKVAVTYRGIVRRTCRIYKGSIFRRLATEP